MKRSGSRTAAARCGTALFALVATGGADAGEPRPSSRVDPGAREPGALGAEARVPESAFPRGPRLHPRLSPRVTAALHEAIPLARERLRRYPSCQALFAHLGTDGLSRLEGTSYYPAGAEQEARYCRGGNHAVTTVGGSAVVLCPSFARLSDQEAATILIHEALHFAGQTEYPSDPDAPDGVALTRTVREGCRLFGCTGAPSPRGRRIGRITRPRRSRVMPP